MYRGYKAMVVGFINEWVFPPEFQRVFTFATIC
jgi:hypothetical protein